MSHVFCCGQFGCTVIDIDDEAQEYAVQERTKWAWEQQRIKGEFPSIDEQAEYFETAYNRFKSISVVK